MIDLATILPSILENITNIIPARIVRNYQRGLLYIFGRRICDIEPGWPIVWFPILMSCEVMDCATTVIETEIQTVETKDGQTISVSCAVQYSIWSLYNWFSIQDGQQSLGNKIQGAITEACRCLTWAQIKEGGQILDIILQDLNESIDEWGVTIEDVELINCARTTTIRLIGSGTVI